LSLRLLIDEDSLAKVLVKILRVADHDVITVNELGLSGQPDPVVLNYARQNNRILLTHNCRDFEALHQENPRHPGILAIYENRDYSKDLSRGEVVKAIANLEAANIPLSNQFISLNHWNY
jgi:predicted nuclease of predicted toxin-antitoxin system